jgi:hypothetical protein
MALKYTLDEVRQREVAHLNTKGLPAVWWTLPAGNDCLGFQLYCMGERSGKTFADEDISISHFRKAYKWTEVPMVSAKPGDLVLENWGGSKDADGNLTAEHIEYVYAVDHNAKTITTISANTGPKPGVPVPRGVYKKTRPLDGHFLKAVRCPYKDPKLTNARVAEVRRIATYLNSLHLGRTSAAADDGQAGENYYWMIQHWGHAERTYPKSCVEDGVPGDYTRKVEKILSTLTAKLALSKHVKA